MIEVMRDDERLALELAAAAAQRSPRRQYWALGIGAARGDAPAYDAKLQYGPLAAIRRVRRNRQAHRE